MTRPQRLSLTAATAVVVGALAGAGAGPSAAASGPAPSTVTPVHGDSIPPVGGPGFAPGELLVRFRGGAPERRLELPAGIGVRQAARALGRNPNVRWAVPDYIAHASAPGWIPNDRGLRSSPPGGWQELQWNFLPCGTQCGRAPAEGLESFGGIDAPGAWQNLIEARRPGARGVKVAVIDTGVAHRNRGKAFRRSPDLKRSQFLPGHDYVDGDKTPLDENGHGTHVASTIAERTDNGKFVTGLAYGAKLIPVRALDEHGAGLSSDVAKGIRWAYRHRADVINLSLEFSRSSVDGCDDVPNVCEAVDRATAKGAVVIAGSGNTGARSVSFPARAPNVIAVGATTIRGCLADYSAYGEGLDLVAPGGGSDAALAGPQCHPAARGPGIVQLTLINPRSGIFTEFGYPRPEYDGTSMASAHVAAAAAMVIAAQRRALGRRPGPEEVAARLAFTARRDEGLDDTEVYGAGLIDAAAATAR
jgi:serine protease